jgi:hypothetical protein
MATKTQVLRKAVMKKNKKSDIGEKFTKGSEVFIQETCIGQGKFRYVASNDKKLVTGVAVTKSEFEFTDDETFVVMVTRISYSTRPIEVKAKDRKKAEELANIEAGNQVFKEDDAEYKIDGVYTKAQFINFGK